MRPGPIHILACPRCGALAKQRTIPFAATGRKQDLARCAGCKGIFPVTEAKIEGSIPFWQELDAQVFAVNVAAIKGRSKKIWTTLRDLFGDRTEEELRASLPLRVATGLSHLKAAARGAAFEKMGAEVDYEASIPASYSGPVPRPWLEAPDLQGPNGEDLLDGLAAGEDTHSREGTMERGSRDPVRRGRARG